MNRFEPDKEEDVKVTFFEAQTNTIKSPHFLPKKKKSIRSKIASVLSALLLSSTMITTFADSAQAASNEEIYNNYEKHRNTKINAVEEVKGYSERHITCNPINTYMNVTEYHSGNDGYSKDRTKAVTKIPSTRDRVMDANGDYIKLMNSLERKKSDFDASMHGWDNIIRVVPSTTNGQWFREYGTMRTQHHFPRYREEMHYGLLFSGYLVRDHNTYRSNHDEVKAKFVDPWVRDNCGGHQTVTKKVRYDKATGKMLTEEQAEEYKEKNIPTTEGFHTSIVVVEFTGADGKKYHFEMYNKNGKSPAFAVDHWATFRGILTVDLPNMPPGEPHSNDGDIAMDVAWKMYRNAPDKPTVMEAQVLSAKAQGTHFEKRPNLTTWVEINKPRREIDTQIKQLKGTPKGNTFDWGKVDVITEKSKMASPQKTYKDVEVEDKLTEKQIEEEFDPPNTLTIGGYYNYTNEWYWVCGLTTCWKVADWDYEQRYIFHKTIPIALDFQHFYEKETLDEINEPNSRKFLNKGKAKEGQHFQIAERYKIKSTSVYDASHPSYYLTKDSARENGIEVEEFVESVTLDGFDSHALFTQTTLPITPIQMNYDAPNVPIGSTLPFDKAEVKEGIFGFYHPIDVDEAMRKHTKNDIFKYGDERVAKDELGQKARADSKGDYMIPFAQVTKDGNVAKFETDYTSVSKNTGFATIYERFKDVRANYASGKPPLPKEAHIAEMIGEHQSEFKQFGKEDFKDKILYTETNPTADTEAGLAYDRKKLMRYYTPLDDKTATTIVSAKSTEPHKHYIHMYDIGLNHGGLGYNQPFTITNYLTGIDGGEKGGYLFTQPETVTTGTDNMSFTKTFTISASEKPSLAQKSRTEFKNKIFGIRVTKRNFSER